MRKGDPDKCRGYYVPWPAIFPSDYGFVVLCVECASSDGGLGEESEPIHGECPYLGSEITCDYCQKKLPSPEEVKS